MKISYEKKIDGYADALITCSYTPKKIGPWHFKLKIYFENFQDQKELDFTLEGESVEVPIKAQLPLYDFKICLLGQVYKNKVFFENQGDSPSKIVIK